MTSVTPPSRSMRMNPLGLKSRAAWAPAASAVPMRAGRLKLTSRPPPAAAPALRKVRRDRVCTAVEINSPNGFPQQDHTRSEEHTSELQSLTNLVCRLLLQKKKKKQ